MIVHIPHASTNIPELVRGQFQLNDSELKAELLAMTDSLSAILRSQSFVYQGVGFFLLGAIPQSIPQFVFSMASGL
jgi:hypothetical protein